MIFKWETAKDSEESVTDKQVGCMDLIFGWFRLLDIEKQKSLVKW